MFFFRVLSSPRRVSDFVIMARNSQQSDEQGELMLRDGSDLEDNFNDSSIEQDLSDESDFLDSLPPEEEIFSEGAFRSLPPCDLSSQLADNDEVPLFNYFYCSVHRNLCFRFDLHN